MDHNLDLVFFRGMKAKRIAMGESRYRRRLLELRDDAELLGRNTIDWEEDIEVEYSIPLENLDSHIDVYYSVRVSVI
jgi:hypothetical protein